MLLPCLPLPSLGRLGQTQMVDVHTCLSKPALWAHPYPRHASITDPPIPDPGWPAPLL